MEGHHITRDELERRFGYHPPTETGKKERHEEVRATLLDSADKLIELTGAPCPEQSIMVRNLEEAMFWANAAVARPQT